MTDLILLAIGVVNTALVLMVFRAFLPLVLHMPSKFVRLVATGIVVGSVAAVVRMAWWDWITLFLSDPALIGLREATGWRVPNIIFAVLCAWSSWFLLRAYQEMIPLEERQDWPLWRAWAYPGKRCILPVFRARRSDD